jgi:autotransporter-associated beta strand protein
LRGTAAASGINVRIHEGTFTVEGSERFIGASNANFTIGSSTSTAKVVFGNAASGGTETINTITPGVLSGSSLVGGGAGLYTLTVNNSGTQDWTNLKVGGTGTNENNLALVFTNTGTTTLGAANTYTGSTTISGGKVIVSGSLSGTATVSVASSATLASGTSGGSITTSATTGNAVDISGTLSPGDTAFAPITLTLDGAARLNFNSGAQLRLDVGAENSSDTVIFGGLAADRLFGSSNATLALTGVVDYASTYTVFLNVTTTGFLFAGITGYDSTNYNAVFARSGNDYQLSFVAVPEPGSLAALFGGVGLLAGLQRLRRKPGSR